MVSYWGAQPDIAFTMADKPDLASIMAILIVRINDAFLIKL